MTTQTITTEALQAFRSQCQQVHNFPLALLCSHALAGDDNARERVAGILAAAAEADAERLDPDLIEAARLLGQAHALAGYSVSDDDVLRQLQLTGCVSDSQRQAMIDAYREAGDE